MNGSAWINWLGLAWKEGKALQAKERLQEGWKDAREGAAGKGASCRRKEGNNNTIRRCDDDDDDDDDWSAKKPQHFGRPTTDTAIEGASTGGV